MFYRLLSFAGSVVRSVKGAIAANPDVQRLLRRHPRIVGFIRRRFARGAFSGLPLTLIGISFAYVAALFMGIAEDIVTSDPIVAADVRVANLFYAFRTMGLVRFFTWITLLGSWPMVTAAAVAATIVLWTARKRVYLMPLWAALVGSVLFTQIGKFAFHRPRPSIAYYVEHGYSFPSAHATVAVAFYGFLAYVLARELHGRGRKAAVWFLGIILALTIGISRLYLDVHYISDVWGGYLAGLLLLIVGVGLVEWRARQNPRASAREPFRYAPLVTGIVVCALVLFYIGLGLRYHPGLGALAEQHVARVADIISPFQENELPKFTETVLGSAQEPLNMAIVAEGDDELVRAMEAAGWRLADAASPASLLALARSGLRGEPYATAPLTPSFWNAEPHDFGFEKETSSRSVKERHHARFWKTDIETADGRRLYVGTASFDSGIKWLVTHAISPDIDTERELLFADLQGAGSVASSSKESFVLPTLGKNFSGDQFFTDGEIYLVTLR